MDDVGFHVAEHAAQLPGRLHVEFAARREPDEAQAFLRPPLQLAAAMRHEPRGMAERLQTGDELQDLILAAAPGPRRVDVDGRDHGAGVCAWGSGAWSPSAHSFANFRKT